VNVTANCITVHLDGSVSYLRDGRRVLRAASIPPTVWLSCAVQERERVCVYLRRSGYAVTVTSAGEVLIGHARHCGLSPKQAKLLARVRRAEMRKGVAA
jgi:hypothetical protein